MRAKIKPLSVFFFVLSLLTAQAGDDFTTPPKDAWPQTWFHLIGGNVSKPGLTADLEAIRTAGIGGIQLFHGQVGAATAWPRTHEQIPCLSQKWDDLIGFAADECARLGLKFEMQNCPGWSMSGGPWVPPEKAMRKLVCFEPGKKPAFNADDDYREIGTVSFPAPAGWGTPDPVPESVTTNGDVRVYTFAHAVTLRTLSLPAPQELNHPWAYEPGLSFVFEAESENGWKRVLDRRYPRGCWQDSAPISFAFPATTAKQWRLTFTRTHDLNLRYVRFSSVAHLDNWETCAGLGYRELPAHGTLDAAYERGTGEATLVFGHVNMKRRNGPAPREATGWECDKLDPEGFKIIFDNYLGRLMQGPLAGGKLKGMVVDSWECGCPTWTGRMEEYFRKLNGYDLRANLPALFGFVPASDKQAEAFLRDWRETISTLIEEHYYRVIAETGRQHGLDVQFETAFADVVPGDPLRFWKYADRPMCEFWRPHDNTKGFVGSDNFKPVRPCVSGAHLYGKRRVQAEALTSFSLDFDENFDDFKRVADRHFARGVTHLVFHTYTHHPQTGADFLPPGTSFGARIGSPFLRGQTWWRFMPHLTTYFARCGMMLERGKPVVDVLWYLGDAVGYRPDENAPFPEGYKYDYCTWDALATRLDVKDGRFVLPDGMSYRVLWIPEGTFLLPRTEKRLAELTAKGARILRGELKPDWPSELEKLGGLRPKEWYQRRDGDEDIFFVILPNQETVFITVKDGVRQTLDPVTGRKRDAWRDTDRSTAGMPLTFTPCANYPDDATERVYTTRVKGPAEQGARAILSLGKVRDWAEIEVNGERVETLWCTPYVCDIGRYLTKETNEIRVTVTSTWHNRIIRDRSRPENERTTWTIEGPKAGDPLRPSGLLGPSHIGM